MDTDTLGNEVADKFAYQPLFIQAVTEFLESITELSANFSDADWARLRRLLVPERIISFRVDWMDDTGTMQSNLGYRVQYNSALGPYKGGLRFDPSVNEDVLKFLGFEQIFKNALTGLMLGAGKGGSDFNPKGKSDNEIRSFARAFMLELQRHIGPDTDIPAGDIGVGGREIGYMYGMYKQISNKNEGVLTGKDELFGGSCGRTEATGHGVVYFAEAMVKQHGLDLATMTAVVSGSGNVAQFTARKLIELGATVLTLSDRAGYLLKTDGFTQTDVKVITEGKAVGKSLADIEIEEVEYHEGKVWSVQADAYFPCATQNELAVDDATGLVAHAKLLVEGANMPLTAEALAVVRKSDVLYAPGKASNAGGVAVSGIEMAQNAGRYAWTCEAVEIELQKIITHIHKQCVRCGKNGDQVDYVKGANIAGFVRVFNAMKKLGI